MASDSGADEAMTNHKTTIHLHGHPHVVRCPLSRVPCARPQAVEQ